MTHDFAELAGYLLGKPEPAELDERGCFRRISTAEVERIVIELMTPDVLEFEVPYLTPVRSGPNDRWRLASCLQKAVRFGLPEMAMTAASGLYSSDRAYALQRLGVIAVEDVMLGAPLLVARALAMMGQHEWRRTVGERRLVVWLAKMAAEAPKDRSAVELHVMVDNDPTLDVAALVQRDDRELEAMIVNRKVRLIERQAAAQVLAGPAYGSDRMPSVSSRTPTGLFRLMVDMDMTRWGLYVAAKTASRLRDSMFVSLPMIDGWLQAGHYGVVDGPDFPKPMVGDVLGAAYDKYTRPGLQAIRRFVVEVPEVAAFIRAVPPPKRRYAAGVGVFLGEGGVLARRAVYGDESEAVHRWARSTDRLYWLPRALAGQYVETVRRNLDRLNEIRAEVVWSGSR